MNPSDRYSKFSSTELSNIIDNYGVSKNTNLSTENSVNILFTYMEERGYTSNLKDLNKCDLDGLLYIFFAEVRTEKGDLYKKTSYNSLRYGINRHLQTIWRDHGGIDIINDIEFRKSKEMFQAMVKQMKSVGKCQVNHWPSIPKEDLKKMNNFFEMHLEIPSTLQEKVFVDVCVYFGNRGRESLHDLLISDFNFSKDSQGRLFATRKDTLTKNHQADDNTKQGTIYEQITLGEMCPLKTLQKYLSMLNPSCMYFFQRPKKFKNTKGPSFDNIRIGNKTIGNFMPNISLKAGLSMKFTNHSLRSTCISILNETGEEHTNIIKVTGHKSTNSLKTYTGILSSNKRQHMSAVLSAELYANDEPVEAKKKPVASTSSVTVNRNDADENFDSDSNLDDLMANMQYSEMNQNVQNNNRSIQPIFNNCKNNKITINYHFNK